MQSLIMIVEGRESSNVMKREMSPEIVMKLREVKVAVLGVRMWISEWMVMEGFIEENDVSSKLIY